MFSSMHGDEILATDSQDIPIRAWQPRAARGGNPPPAQKIREVFFCATRDSKSGIIYLKVVNVASAAQQISIQIKGASKVVSEGEAVSLTGTDLNDTNTIEQPQKIIPRTEKVVNLSSDFVREFSPYSITILKLKTK